MSHSHDVIFLKEALKLAHIRRGFCAPNPAVGAIIVQDNQIVASGYHSGPGTKHAEIDALSQLSGDAIKGATMYVTLEPCCHFGRTPPCTDALIQSGLKRIIYGFRDPNPVVAGKGHHALEAAGIDVLHHPLPELDVFYQSYQHWHLTQKPCLTAKIALSLDGKIAAKSGRPIQITGRALQEFTHQRRKASDAILTTAKTIIADDPALNVRLEKTPIAKPLFILDSELSIPVTAKIFTTAESITLFHAEKVSSSRVEALRNRGARCIPVDKTDNGLALDQVIHCMGEDGRHDVWIEAGGKCFSAFVQQRLLQRAFIYIAPVSIGQGLAAFDENLDLLAGTRDWQWRQYGKDVLCEIHW